MCARAAGEGVLPHPKIVIIIIIKPTPLQPPPPPCTASLVTFSLLGAPPPQNTLILSHLAELHGVPDGLRRVARRAGSPRQETMKGRISLSHSLSLSLSLSLLPSPPTPPSLALSLRSETRSPRTPEGKVGATPPPLPRQGASRESMPPSSPLPEAPSGDGPRQRRGAGRLRPGTGSLPPPAARAPPSDAAPSPLCTSPKHPFAHPPS